MDLITLVCPPGAADYPVSHGLVDYQPEVFRKDYTDRDSARHLTVPRYVAQHFLSKGGFSLAKLDVAPALSGETVRLVDKNGALERSLGFNGVSYEMNAEGVMTVPAEAAGVAASHDLVPASPEKPQTKAEARAEAKEAKAEAAADAKAERAEARAEAKAEAKADKDEADAIADAKAEKAEAKAEAAATKAAAKA